MFLWNGNIEKIQQKKTLEDYRDYRKYIFDEKISIDRKISGFVLAFLFAMNKQYIKKSSDDLGFILIDDPVQTMDDINISSLIEVLRNDFSEKQIILSTHEIDKENYILYKFYKYNQLGQSFNVKEKLYGV